jgi:hypothetical protein
MQRDAFLERALEAQHPGALSEVQELERGIELAERAVEMGREEIIRDSDVPVHQFNALAEPIESRAGVPWLWKNGDSVIVVDLDKNVGRAPTAEELETGIFFTSFEEYQAANSLTGKSHE